MGTGLGFIAQIGTQHTLRDTSADLCLRKPVILNEYDYCCCTEAQLWNQLVARGGLHTLCCPQGRTPYPYPPWVKMPKEGRRFKPNPTLLVSTAVPFTGLSVNVLTERVPYGYDGVIEDVVCEVVADAGTGFTEGSGDITWRLSADGRYLRDEGNLTITVGSLITPSPVGRGMIRVFSGNLLKFDVVFAVGAEVNINPQARIVCSITGWYYPR
jgi:hypothetical protein